MLENIKKSADNGNQFGALLTDLFIAFDCIDHKLLIAKLFWYGVLPSALIHSYLINRTQTIKINNGFSRRSIIEHGVPQGSVLGPLLFNIDLVDFFMKAEIQILPIMLAIQLHMPVEKIYGLFIGITIISF